MNPNTEKLVHQLIDRGFTWDLKDKLGATPIFYAAVNPSSAILEHIMENDDQYLRVYDKKQNTPLIMAIIGRRVDNITLSYRLAQVQSRINQS